MKIEEALERMREANRRSPKPVDEASFEQGLQELAIPLMRQGLVDDVEDDPGFEPEPVQVVWLVDEADDLDEIDDLMEPQDVVATRKGGW